MNLKTQFRHQSLKSTYTPSSLAQDFVHVLAKIFFQNQATKRSQLRDNNRNEVACLFKIVFLFFVQQSEFVTKLSGGGEKKQRKTWQVFC